MKKQIKIRVLITFFLLCTLYSVPCTASTISPTYYFGYKLSFYNLIKVPFSAFRRNHQFALGCKNINSGDIFFDIEAQYNWIDEVDGSISTHTLTSWVFDLSGILNRDASGANEAAIKYIYFVNLSSPWLNKTVTSVEYRRTAENTNFAAIAKAGIGYADKIIPIYGAEAVYLPASNMTANIKLNYLEANEDNPEFRFKLPISIGLNGRFSSQAGFDISGNETGLGFEFLLDPFRSHMISPSGSNLVDHWFKGYLGEQLVF